MNAVGVQGLVDWQAVWITLKLAGLTTLILMALGTAIAWGLAQSRHWSKRPLEAIISLPLVLPPTVLGFYLLLLLGPKGPIGEITQALGLGVLPFTFPGLVVASVIYSLPFAVQPIQNAFETLGARPLEVAATLRASPWDRFMTVALPLSRSGLITAAVLVFAHTIGEFGIVLMIGGAIAGETKVLSVAIYDHVEAIEYTQANILSAGMLIFSFTVLLALQIIRKPAKVIS
ncbi:molybdate ABC transporter, permease protein [Hahella chejuensis KCTC 2396]|uniref:Molybdenum transport system permease n=1 Tax=Hahella chejuensis (strain KCTC 2396) TaxID=349521 RepID=Q2SJB4_HAHCH|nr:molybdate ABC transporter permease subunit [Hahella chejuensis]ABC29260.1 molybdate ABC transporter, permease protein [Hahella chejuensis KCTC 2396]